MQQGYSAVQCKGSLLQGPGTTGGWSSSWHPRAVLRGRQWHEVLLSSPSLSGVLLSSPSPSGSVECPG